MSIANKLNTLEKSIVSAEDSAEDARWAQAKEVVRLLDSGLSQREVAAQWINGRTEKPYEHKHVRICAGAWKRFGSLETRERPTWSDAYETVQQGSKEVVSPFDRQRKEREAQPPQSVESAERFVQNVIDKAPDKVRYAIEEGLRAHRHDLPGPVERKARQARADEEMQPLKHAVDEFAKMEIVSALENAVEILAEMIEEQTLDADRMRQIDAANERWLEELEVARAMVGTEDRA
jgi:hypothetical protein